MKRIFQHKTAAIAMVLLCSAVLALTARPHFRLMGPLCELRTQGIPLGPHLAFGEIHWLLDLRRLRPLSMRLVDYEGVKASAQGTKAAFIDYAPYRQAYPQASGLAYRLVVYDMQAKALRAVVQEPCVNTSPDPGAVLVRCQIHRFEWVDDSVVRYSFNPSPAAQEWLFARAEAAPEAQ